MHYFDYSGSTNWHMFFCKMDGLFRFPSRRWHLTNVFEAEGCFKEGPGLESDGDMKKKKKKALLSSPSRFVAICGGFKKVWVDAFLRLGRK